MFHPKFFHLTHTPDDFTCLCCLIFISLYLISSSSTSFKLRLGLNKIDFDLSSPKCILSLLSTSQSQILRKPLVNCFLFQWHSYAGRAGINHLHIGTSRILQLGSHHWHKSKTVEDLKLNLAEHHMKYFRILKPILQLLQ